MTRRWNRRSALFLLLLAAIALQPVTAWAATITADPVATDLNKPTAFTFAPDGRIFYAERLSGEIRILDLETSSDSLFLDVAGSRSLVGLALHPSYPAAPFVYAYTTRVVSPQVRRDQLLRIRDEGGTAGSIRALLDIPSMDPHHGGRILFGPDDKLYVVIGDEGDPANSQDLASPAGKIHRMTPAGRVPASGNPFPGSTVYAYGLRNSIGFDFDPVTGRLWQTDNGPECNDELNRIVKGRNHGWGPSATCSTPPDPPRNTNRDGPSPVLPRRFYNPVTAPVGAAFCSSCELGADSEGALFFGEYITGAIRRVILNSTRLGVANESMAYVHSGPVLSIEEGPDGGLYFSDDTAIFKLVAA